VKSQTRAFQKLGEQLSRAGALVKPGSALFRSPASHRIPALERLELSPSFYQGSHLLPYAEFWKALEGAYGELQQGVVEGRVREARLALLSMQTVVKFARVYNAIEWLTRPSGVLEPANPLRIAQGIRALKSLLSPGNFRARNSRAGEAKVSVGSEFFHTLYTRVSALEKDLSGQMEEPWHGKTRKGEEKDFASLFEEPPRDLFTEAFEGFREELRALDLLQAFRSFFPLHQ
jgi:hypothetical protein